MSSFCFSKSEGRRNKHDLGMPSSPVGEDILDVAGLSVSGSHQVLTDY